MNESTAREPPDKKVRRCITGLRSTSGKEYVQQSIVNSDAVTVSSTIGEGVDHFGVQRSSVDEPNVLADVHTAGEGSHHEIMGHMSTPMTSLNEMVHLRGSHLRDEISGITACDNLEMVGRQLDH